MLEVGDKAPAFTLADQDGKEHSLADYLGKWVLIYFYPKDMTPGCTMQACGVRDAKPDFEKLDAVVLGVSKDSESSHKKFEDKHDLNFTLLSDESTDMIQAYGAWKEKSMFGKKYMGIQRMSYLINPDGEVAKVYEKAKTASHAEDVLKDLEKLRA
jgi:peroxiredoxin Q/BCP